MSAIPLKLLRSNIHLRLGWIRITEIRFTEIDRFTRVTGRELDVRPYTQYGIGGP